ncbi:MAG: hypothetical protein HY646_08570 [Acidobacteria bacterium]|nr:hypothetical protein [Acidobacteriota bacterium]
MSSNPSRSAGKFNLNREERRLLRKLFTPEKVQKYLDDLPYNKEREGDTCLSPRLAIRHNTAHCFEGALLAAAALRVNGRPPLILDLKSVRDDDHVIAVFRTNGCWGAIGKSNYAGLRFRSPVYRTLRELAMSYFEHYYNLKGEKTLRAYSRPVNLARFDSIHWMAAEEPLWAIPKYLCEIKHIAIFGPATPPHVHGRTVVQGRPGGQSGLGGANGYSPMN